jgi:hypothetical protein
MTGSTLLSRTLIFLGVLALLLAATIAAGPWLVERGLRAVAARRGLAASWQSLRLRPPLGLAIQGLAFTSAAGDTVLRARTLDIDVDPLSALVLQPRPREFQLVHARIALYALRGGAPVPDLPEEPRSRRHPGPDRLPAARRTAERLVHVLTSSPAGLPQVDLEDVAVELSAGKGEPAQSAYLERLRLAPQAGGKRLEARGTLHLDTDVPFAADLDYGSDESLAGRIVFRIGPAKRARPESLAIGVRARLTPLQHPRGLGLADGSQVTLGRIPLAVAGSLTRSGPRLTFALSAARVRPADIVASVPAAWLGPLLDVSLTGWFGYRLSFDLDLAHPEDVDFHADVMPHGLAIDAEHTRLNLLGLEAPFAATIHLPHGQIALRELSADNPGFRSLDGIDSTLTHAVVANEDGGFFHHRGFNTDAVKASLVENLHAGAFRRGAGTITMQLARNLYLGHDRTLPRKAQEVAMAWMLEHLTGVSKRRLLEIYLNIIEWGPGVHGAEEACLYYFGHNAGSLSVAEALFLATVVPAPNRWQYRFDPAGNLRPFVRAQMHFIGRAMIAKGWLQAEQLPASDSLAVALTGPARMLLAAPADTLRTAPPDSGSSAPDSAGVEAYADTTSL